MTHLGRFRPSIALALSLTTPAAAVPNLPASAGKAQERPFPKHEELREETPIYFEPNVGQTDSRVRFLARGGGATTFLTDTEMVVVLRKALEKSGPDGSPPRTDSEVVRMGFAGATGTPEAVGLEPLPGISGYFKGNDPSRWRGNVPHYAKVRFAGLYPGIDLVYRGTQGQVEYDLVVQPGADPSRIELAFDGITGARTDAVGDLLLTTRLGDIRHRRPRVYQNQSGRDVEIAASYTVNGRRVGFALARYDSSQPLTIDPVISYSSYLGGAATDVGEKIAVDPNGNAFIVGWTASTNFPTKFPYQTDRADYDVFVTKLSRQSFPPVVTIAWSTYLGGNGTDVGRGIALEHDGTNVFVAGYTSSTDFPTKQPFQINQPGTDGFVSKLSFWPGAGLALVWSTYLGGSADDRIFGLSVDHGYAAVTGGTESTNFPTVHALQADKPGADAFVTVFKPSTGVAPTALYYSTYLGGNDSDVGYSIGWDIGLTIAGQTYSSDFPSKQALQGYAGGGDAFVTRIFSSTTAPSPPVLAYSFSTTLGGSAEDCALGVFPYFGANSYVVGYTKSGDFPTIHPIQSDGPGVDGFVANVFYQSVGGSSLRFSTYLAGKADEMIYAVTADRDFVWIAAATQSNDLPVVNTTLGPKTGWDGYVARIDVDSFSKITIGWSAYLGGAGTDSAYGIAQYPTSDFKYHVCVTGVTTSTDFPVKWPYQGTNAGGTSSFVTQFDE